MDRSPSCWVDPFQAKFHERRLTQVAPMAEPPSRDVIELQQVALWHGVKSRISQASEAAAGGVERAPRGSRIRFRPEGISSTPIHHREHATSSLTLPAPLFALSSSAVELPRASCETFEVHCASDASDSGMSGGYCAP